MALETPTTLTIGAVASKGSKQFQGLFSVIPFTFNLEEDSIAASVGSGGTVAVAGAEVGDLVLIAPAQAVSTLAFVANVSAAGVVAINAFNLDAAANTQLAVVGKGKGVVLKFSENVFAQL
jgi:hypothetical protein